MNASQNLFTIRAAEVLIMVNRRQAAIDLVERLITWEPDYLDGWLFLARRYTDSNHPAAASAWQQVARLRARSAASDSN